MPDPPEPSKAGKFLPLALPKLRPEMSRIRATVEWQVTGRTREHICHGRRRLHFRRPTVMHIA